VQVSYALKKVKGPHGDEYPAGFHSVGQANVMGVRAKLDVLVSPSEFHYYAELDPLRLGPFVVRRSASDLNQGPVFKAALKVPFSFKVTADAYVKCNFFQAKVTLELTPSKFSFDARVDLGAFKVQLAATISKEQVKFSASLSDNGLIGKLSDHVTSALFPGAAFKPFRSKINDFVSKHLNGMSVAISGDLASKKKSLEFKVKLGSGASFTIQLEPDSPKKLFEKVVSVLKDEAGKFAKNVLGVVKEAIVGGIKHVGNKVVDYGKSKVTKVVDSGRKVYNLANDGLNWLSSQKKKVSDASSKKLKSAASSIAQSVMASQEKAKKAMEELAARARATAKPTSKKRTGLIELEQSSAAAESASNEATMA